MKKSIVAFVLVIAGSCAFAMFKTKSTSARQVATANPPSGSAVGATLPPSDTRLASSGEGNGYELISGVALEVIQVPKYTYIRVGGNGAVERWTAVASSPIEQGSHVEILAETTLNDFSSVSLKRTFKQISFGSLHRQGDERRKEANLQGNPHVDCSASGDSRCPQANRNVVDVTPMTRASGLSGRTVVEVFDKRKELSGKTIRVHAKVTKVTLDVLGKNYVHVRDGSGDPKAGSHDLAVTTVLRPNLGDEVTLEGKLAIDRDLGSGYHFVALLEDATLVT